MGTPKYATPRTPANPTFGGRVALIAENLLQTPLMPWQRLVADVALELDPANPGAFRYDDVRITVPRQAGKTALVRAVHLDRIIAYQRHVTMMTAQTGKAARKRWDQIVQAIEVEKHPHHWRRMASRGSESLEYTPSGSTLAPFPPTETDGHGDSLHLVSIDEAWAFDEHEGINLDAAINPTMLTIKDSQRWVVSTKGTAKSHYLNRLIEEGREATKDPRSHIAYFEWSANEEAAEADPYSDETLDFHPAIGHTQSAEKIRRLGSKESLITWRRSYLNLDDPTGGSAPIDLALWDSLADPAPGAMPPPAAVTVAFDVAADLSAATIYAAWATPEGIRAEMLATEPGYQWLPDRLKQLAAAGFTRLICDPVGATSTLCEEVRRAGIIVDETTPRAYAAACQWLILAARSEEISHDGAAATRLALENTAVRHFASTPVWDSRKSPTPIDALRSLTIAAFTASKPQSTGITF